MAGFTVKNDSQNKYYLSLKTSGTEASTISFLTGLRKFGGCVNM